MKKILFVTPSFNLGGITFSLLNLLSIIDKEKYDITLFAMTHQGPSKKEFLAYKLLPENEWISVNIIEGSLEIKVKHFIINKVRQLLKLFNINLWPFIYSKGSKQMRLDQYDAVITFSEGDVPYTSLLKAKRLISWMHCDYRRRYEANDHIEQKLSYKRIDKVVCVSEFAKKTFCEIFPEYADKTAVVYNYVNAIEITRKSNLFTPQEIAVDNTFNIISVGRLDPIKQFEKIPSILKNVNASSSIKIKWYIIGDGDNSVKDSIVKEIQSNNQENSVFLLGAKDNPYPYIKACNLLIHTSASESYSLVMFEALTLGIPVIVNDYECAFEFVKKGMGAVVVPLCDMSNTIRRIVDEEEYYELLRQEASNYTFPLSKVINSFEKII